MSIPNVASIEILPHNEWDTFLVLGLPSSPSLLPTLSSSCSGEFNQFSFVGAAVAHGDGCSFLPGNAICLGNMSGLKFCLKSVAGASACTIPTHFSHKAKPAINYRYIMDGDT
jgi:hypothetical protein